MLQNNLFLALMNAGFKRLVLSLWAAQSYIGSQQQDRRAYGDKCAVKQMWPLGGDFISGCPIPLELSPIMEQQQLPPPNPHERCSGRALFFVV